MRIPALPFLAPIFLAISMIPAAADDLTGRDWQLLAIDGQVLDFDIIATLRIAKDGAFTGKAPCNSWGTQNRATLPALELRGIRATRRACDKLAEENAFFDALSVMTALRIEGRKNLIFSGPDGRTMEFVTDRMNSLTRCLTCPPNE
ncbi:MAG: META domain-containing protein [Tabrizicola sp.]|jgi:heat shock protein HslJ|nr:META domain-containing protein [Tabrizicola sp.]